MRNTKKYLGLAMILLTSFLVMQILQVMSSTVPANISGTATRDSIAITWDAVNDAVGYDIEVDGAVMDNELSLSYEHINLTADTQHTYRVRARFAEETGEWSDAINISTLEELGIPAVTGNPASSSITINWNAIADAEGYDIEVDGIIIDNGAATEYLHSGLSQNTEHIYRVRAKDSISSGAWSEAVNIITTIDIPANLKAQSDGSVISISWSPVSEADGYDIEINGVIFDAGTSTSYTYNNSTPNVQHSFRVRAKMDSAVSEWSSECKKSLRTEISSTTILQNTVWDNIGSPYILLGNVTINTGVTLEVRENTLIKANDSRSIIVNGTLKAVGTSQTPIVFTSSYDSEYGGTGVSSSYGYWGGIKIEGTGEFNGDYVKFNYCYDYSRQNSSGYNAAIDVIGKIALTNSQITNTQGYGIYVNTTSEVTTIKNNQISNNNNYPIYIASNGMKSSVFEGIADNTFTGNKVGSINKDIIGLYGGTIQTNIVMKEGIYELNSSLTIAEGISMKINAGTVILANNNYYKPITIQGEMNATGTSEKPIVFTSSYDPNYGGTGVVDSYKYWAGIRIEGTGEFNGDYVKFNYCYDYSRQNSSGYNAAIDVIGKIALTNSQITNTQGYGIYVNTTSDVTTIKNNQISNNNNYPIYIASNGMKSSVFDGIADNTFTGNKVGSINKDIIGLYGGTIQSDIVMKEGIYELTNMLTIPQGKGITIRPGTIILSSYKNNIITVQGTLNAIGTSERPIVFTTSYDAEYGGTGVIDYDKYWRGISIDGTGELVGDYIKVKYCYNSNTQYYYNYSAAIDVKGKIALTNSQITNGEGYGIYVNTTSEVTTIKNNQISNNNNYPIYIASNGMKSSVFDGIADNTFTGNKVGSINKDIIGLYGGTVQTNIVMKEGIYELNNSLMIPQGKNISIEPGVVLLSKNQYILISVEGSMNSIGTNEKPIVFTTSNDPVYGGSGAASSSYGWRGINIGSKGEFVGDYTKIKYAMDYYSPTYYYSAITVSGKLGLTNSQVVNSYNYGIRFNTNIQPVLKYNSFINNYDQAVYNANSNINIDAMQNYWDSYFGPSIYDYTTYKWIGNGQKVSSGVLYDPWLGTDLISSGKFGKTDSEASETGTYPATGNFTHYAADMEVDTAGLSVSFARTYNSLDNNGTSILGKGWTFSFQGSIKDYPQIPNIKVVTLLDGSTQAFTLGIDGTYTANDTRNKLVKTLEGAYILTTKEQYSYGFDLNGNLSYIKDRNNNVLNIEVQADGKLTKITDSAGRQFLLSYNADGLLQRITDPIGRTVTYEYEGSKLIRAISPTGKTERYSYDAEGYLSEIRDTSSSLIQGISYEHTAGENQHKVKQLTDAHGNIFSYSYNNSNSKTTITDINGRQTVKYYDSCKYIHNSIDPEGRATTTEYFADSNGINKFGEIKSVTDRYGNKTQYELDNAGNITKQINPDLSSKLFTYDAKNNLTSEKDENGKYTYYIYDSGMINLIKAVKPLNGTDVYSELEDQSKFAIVNYSYYTDEEGQQLGYMVKGLLKAVTNAKGNTVSYTYDMYGNIKTITDGENNITTYAYNQIGWLTSQTSPLGYTTSFEYNMDGQTAKQILQGGETTRTIYDSEGRIVKLIAPKLYSSSLEGAEINDYSGNHGYTYTYYPNGNKHTETDPEGNTTSFTYDIYGNTKTETKPNGAVYTYEYDVMNRPIKLYFKESSTGNNMLLEEFAYTKLSDGKTQIKNTKYLNDLEMAATIITKDYAGRDIEQLNADGTRLLTSYNANGTINTSTDAKGSITYFKYDGLNRLSEKWIPFEINGGTTLYTYTKYTYDKEGNITEEKQGKNKVNLWGIPSEYVITSSSYDKNGRLKQRTNNADSRTDYWYDADGNILKEAVYAAASIANTTEYVNSYLGKPQQKKVYVRKGSIHPNLIDDINTIILTTDYEYDKNGNLKAVTTPNGVTKQYSYDNMDRLISSLEPGVDEHGGSTVISSHKTYNWNGDILTQTDANGNTTSYEYDTRGLLLRVIDSQGGTTAYYYDRSGRKTAEVSPNNYNEALSLSEMNRTEYAYENMNRLKIVKDIYYDASSSQWIEIVSKAYKYDEKGNIIKELDAIGYKAAYGSIDEEKQTLIDTNPYIFNEEGLNNSSSATYPYFVIISQYAKYSGDTDISLKFYNLYRSKTPFYIKKINGIWWLCHDAINGDYSYMVQSSNYQSADWASGLYYQSGANAIHALGNVTNDGRPSNTNKQGFVYSEQEVKGLTNNDYDLSQGYGYEYTYNLANLPITYIDPVSKEMGLSYTNKYEYDAIGRKISDTAANGAVTVYSYDNNSNLLTKGVKKTQASNLQLVETNTYNLLGNITTMTDGNGNTTTYHYNALGKLETEIHPGDDTVAANVIKHQYDVMGNLKYSEASIGEVHIFEYDNQGRVISVISKKHNGSEAITITSKYDKNGNKRFTTDGNGNITEYVYDSLNRVISETKAGKADTYTYDKNGNITASTDWLGNAYINVYDALNRLIEKRDPSNIIIERLEYNLNNQQTKSIDALGNSTSYTYDNNNRLLSTTDAENHTTYKTYDNVGNVETEKDGRNNIKIFKYDEFNRLIELINAKGEAAKYTYDLNGNMLTQTDGRNYTITYEYNSINKPIRRIDHGGRTGQEGSYSYDASRIEAYTYYSDGSIKTSTDRNGVTTAYTYDIHGRLLSKTIGDIQISYTYDNNGNQLTMTDSTGTTARTYDSHDRVLTKTVPHIGTTSFEYDITANIPAGYTAEASTDPKGNVTTKVYDKQGRLAQVIANGAATTYSYMGNGNRQSIVYPDGSSEAYTYFDNNLVKTLVNKKADGTIIDSYEYSYDGANNQISKMDAKGTTSYTYDSLNRLQAVTEPNGRLTTYTFDESGNRLTETITNGTTTIKAYTYNQQNRLTEVYTTLEGIITEAVLYSYDNNGNQTAIASTAYIEGAAQEPAVVTNTYDQLNQLIITSTASATVINTYNGEGLRAAKSVDGALTRYLYEYDKVILELDESGNQTARNIYGMNLLLRQADGQTAYYMYNAHGDVTALLGTDGTILASYYYDAFGNIAESSESISNPYKYAGYQHDNETGCYYLNARMYDPITARFLQEDTYRGSINDSLSLNLYTYCSNEPIMYIDPTGHYQAFIDGDGGAMVKKKKVGKDTIGVGLLQTSGVYRGDNDDYSFISQESAYDYIYYDTFGLSLFRKSYKANEVRELPNRIAYENNGFKYLYNLTQNKNIMFGMDMSDFDLNINGMIISTKTYSYNLTFTDEVTQSDIHFAKFIISAYYKDLKEGSIEYEQKLKELSIAQREERERAEQIAISCAISSPGISTVSSTGINKNGGLISANAKGKSNNTVQAEKISGSNIKHLNGAIGEAQGYNNALAKGEIGILTPGKVTAPGSDYITFDPKTQTINIWDAKYSSIGKWPNSAKGFGSQSWLSEAQNAINNITDATLKQQVQNAFDSGNINWQIFKWPQ